MYWCYCYHYALYMQWNIWKYKFSLLHKSYIYIYRYVYMCLCLCVYYKYDEVWSHGFSLVQYYIIIVEDLFNHKHLCTLMLGTWHIASCICTFHLAKNLICTFCDSNPAICFDFCACRSMTSWWPDINTWRNSFARQNS